MCEHHSRCCLDTTVGELLELIEELRHRGPYPMRISENGGDAWPSHAPRGTEVDVKAHRVSLRRQGECWIVTCDTDTYCFKPIKGLGYLDYLRRHPGDEFSPRELRIASEGIDPRLSSGPTPPAEECALRKEIQGSTGPLLDHAGKVTLRRSIEELRQEQADAERCADVPRALSARAQRERIEEFVRRAIGFRGRLRFGASAADKDRSTVTHAIRNAIGRIRGQFPAFGDHLDIRVQTGSSCRYLPAVTDRFVWID